jgi:spermidine/putrescine-binding protein
LANSACTKSGNPTAATGGGGAGRTLNLYCWSNYFSPDVLKRFEEKTGAKIVLNYFSSNEELLAKLQAGARGYDVIVPTAYLVGALRELKLLEPLGKLDWPELTQLSQRFQSPTFDPTHEYTVPYAWGTTGIAVNKAKLKQKVDSWAWVFDHPDLKGQVTMLDDAPSVVGAALKYLGYPYNESSDEALGKVKALLSKQKKILKAYTPESQPVLESGEVALAQAYSGDALQVRARKNPNIEFVLPKEGGELFIDSLAIAKGAPSPDLAREFIRFTLDQKTALTQVKHLFFSPVVELKTMAGIGELSTNATVFPSEDQIKNFELMVDNPKRTETIQKLWTELKSI